MPSASRRESGSWLPSARRSKALSLVSIMGLGRELDHPYKPDEGRDRDTKAAAASARGPLGSPIRTHPKRRR